MKTLIRLFVLCFILLSSFLQGIAQTEFSMVYYQEFESILSNSVTKTADESFIIAGQRNHQNFLLKINTEGDTIWNRMIQSVDDYSLAPNIISLKDSTFLMVSNIQFPDSSFWYLLCVKINTAGETIWIRTLNMGNSAFPSSVQQTSDGGFIITGSLYQNTAPYRKIMLLKLDTLGHVQWSRTMIEANSLNYGISVKETQSPGYMISGSTGGDDGSGGVYLMKTNTTGDIEWAKTMVNIDDRIGGGYEFIDLEDGYVLTMQNMDSLIIVRSDITGEVLWAKKYDIDPEMNGNFFGIRFLKLSDYGYVVLVHNEFDYNGSSLIKLDNSGEVIWARKIIMHVTDITELFDKGFLVIGNGPVATPKSSRKFDPKIGVLKIDSLGQNSAECIYPFQIVAQIANVASQVVSFSNEIINVSQVPNSLQIVSKPLTIRNGCVELTGAIAEDILSNHIRVFPNPTTGSIAIQTTNGEQLGSLEVYNAFGKLVYQADALKITETTIDLSGNSSGIYFLKVSRNNKVHSRKILLY